VNRFLENIDKCKSKSILIYPPHLRITQYILAGFIHFIWVPISWALFSWLFGSFLILALGLLFFVLLLDTSDRTRDLIYDRVLDLNAFVKMGAKE
jgi:hypothetical protein